MCFDGKYSVIEGDLFFRYRLYYSLFLLIFFFINGGCIFLFSAQEENKEEQEVSGISYTVEYNGDLSSDIIEEFKEYSQLEKLKTSLPSSATGLGKRATLDKRKLKRLLNTKGYFDAHVFFRISIKNLNAKVVFNIEKGKQYFVGHIHIESSDNPKTFESIPSNILFDILKIAPGDVIDFEKILDSVRYLKRYLHQRGYPYVKIEKPIGYVDHENRLLNLTYKIKTGILVRIAETQIKNLKSVQESFIYNRLLWKDGDIYNVQNIEKTKGSLSGTQLVSSIVVKLSPVDFRDCVLDEKNNPIPQNSTARVVVNESPPRAIGVGIRYSLSEKLGGQFYWHHNNFTGKQDHVGFSFKHFNTYKRLKLEYDLLDFYQPFQELSFQGILLREDDPLRYKGTTQTVSSSFKRRIVEESNLFAHVGVIFEKANLKQDNFEAREFNFNDRHRLIGLPFGIKMDLIEKYNYDLISGMKFSGDIIPYFGKMVGTKNITHLNLKASYYVPLILSPLGQGKTVLVARANFGKIFVKNNARVPLNKTFFAGGLHSVRAYGTNRLSPYQIKEGGRDVLFVGGRSLLEAGFEARYRFNDDWGGVLFADGAFITAPFKEKHHLRTNRFLWGTGIGVRYFTGFGPIRLDVAFPMKRRKIKETNKIIDSRFQFYISIGQNF